MKIIFILQLSGREVKKCFLLIKMIKFSKKFKIVLTKRVVYAKM